MPRKPLREQTELRDVLGRAFHLSRADQIALYEALRAMLARQSGRLSAEEQAVADQRESLAELKRVAQSLGLSAGQAPTVRQFDKRAAELESEWTSARVIRAWGRWRFAVAAMRGESVPLSAAQRSLRRKLAGRRRTHEEYLAGLRIWLATSPPSQTRADYDGFVREYNAMVATTDMAPLVSSGAVRNAFGLGWQEILEVATGLRELPDIRARATAELARSAGPAGLIAAGGVSLILGESRTVVSKLRREGGIPAAVVVVSGRPCWSIEQISAHREGRAIPPWAYDPDDILDSAEVARMLGISGDSLRTAIHERSWHRVPKPAGKPGGVHYWIRDRSCRALAGPK